MISITKKIEFESAHRLSNYLGPCKEIHGHTYKLEVTVTGPIDPDTDMVMDFKELKKILQKAVLDHLDHALILKESEENRKIFSGYSGKITWMETEPTAERMIQWIFLQIRKELPHTIELIDLTLYETSGSFASWKK